MCLWRGLTSGSPSSQMSSIIPRKLTLSWFMASPPHSTPHMTAKTLSSENSDIITHPAALQSTKFLGNTNGHMHQKAHGSLVIYFSDPTIVNACINCHIALYGGLLPIVKFVCRPPPCFNCHHTGHLARSCKAIQSCGLCAEEHDTRHCSSSQKDSPTRQPAPRKCALCSGPHAASDDSCLVCKAAVDKYWVKAKSDGPYYLLPS